MFDELLNITIQSGMKVLGLIPRTWSDRLAFILGSLWFACDRRHRRVVLDNLKLAFGREKTAGELNQLARTVFRNIVKVPFEVGWSTRLGEKQIIPLFEIKGMNHFRKAYERGKGVLLITAHAGNWEFLPITVTSAGYPVNVIYRPLNFKPADAFLFRYRTRFGAKLIPKRRSIRKILKSLQNKECVGILFDQDPGLANGIFVDFFGQPTCTNKGLAFLALRTEAPVLPVFIARRDKKFLVEFGQELPLFRSSDMETDIAVNTLSYNKAIEKFVRKYPEQWFWVHRRWKHIGFAGPRIPNSPAYQPISRE